MVRNTARKIVPDSETSLAKPGERKPPKSEILIDARSEKPVEMSVQAIPAASGQNGYRKPSIPATWAEAIGDPQIWAELRPLLVDED